MKSVYNYILIFAVLLLTTAVSAAEYQRTGSKMTFSWQNTDYVGVYTTDGTLIKYYPSATNGNTATLRSGFGLTDNTSYNAYSPYSKDNWDKSMNALPVSYLNQAQIGNGSTDHLSLYDYQMSSFVTDAGTDNIFFTHAGAILHFCWAMPVDAKVTSITFSCPDSMPFMIDGTMDVTTQTISGTNFSDEVSMTLKGMTLSKSNVMNAYLMVSPVDLTGKKLTARLITSAGDTLTTDVNGTDVSAGHIYPIIISADNTTLNKLGTDTSSASAKSIAGPDLSTASVSSVTAYSPDFTVDSEHTFTIVEKALEDEPARCISVNAHHASQTGNIYNAAGQCITPDVKGLFIVNGKKIFK